MFNRILRKKPSDIDPHLRAFVDLESAIAEASEIPLELVGPDDADVIADAVQCMEQATFPAVAPRLLAFIEEATGEPATEDDIQVVVEALSHNLLTPDLSKLDTDTKDDLLVFLIYVALRHLPLSELDDKYLQFGTEIMETPSQEELQSHTEALDRMITRWLN